MTYPPKINPEKETKKITEFIKDTFKKAGKIKAVIAASGGVDSSTTLLLTAKALGAKNLHVLYLPSKTSAPTDFEHLQLLTKLAKIPNKNLTTINITGIVQKTWRVIKKHTNVSTSEGSQFSLAATARQSAWLDSQTSKDEPDKPSAAKKIAATRAKLTSKGSPFRKKINQQLAELNRLRLANIAARIRMIVIFDQAKLHDALVIGTENRSEHLLGYYTRFGDEASDLEPLRHLYKTQVIQLAKHLKIPKEIIQKPPSAGLWRGQTDEAELGFSYFDADPILFLKYEQQLSSEEIAKKLTKNTQKNSEETEALVKKVLNRNRVYSFKLQLPYQI